ncbi:MAG: 3-phytase [Candidatus Parabeggiatoa sp. nov. 3]|nr:MAG: 3-phytase [Gammaproteobacteria bacterium]RKZ67906.1 MAG: 3-phytase [Gammaproteobacteria bacterium]RKZ83459.1 MAG: 3-phytase [Gammaproteobacteria bacterium]
MGIVKMKYLLMFNLVIVLALETTVLAATQTRSAYFDDRQGIVIPEVVVLPESARFSVKLRQLDSSDFVLDMDSVTPLKASFNYYDPKTGLLYLPELKIGNEIYKAVELKVISETEPLVFRMISADIQIDRGDIKAVQATVETKPVPASGDAADDPAIWIHPDEPARSVVIGTQKQGGLGVYDLAGQEIQYLADGNMNNVDLRYGFPLNDEKVAIVAASNRSNDSIALYKINPETRQLENVAARTIRSGLDVYGLCMYHSASYGKYYVFINDKRGAVEQWEIFDNGNQFVDATVVRRLSVNSQVEGCVADDALGYFYLGEERVGIWKFGAEPNNADAGQLIDTTNKQGNMTAEVEGLTIYYVNETEGYLIASNQGNDTFTVYERAGDNAYLGKFHIIGNPDLKIDAVYDTDGIDVINVPLGEAFPYGVFVAQDGENIYPDENQNFKLVPWEHIADALNLKKETSYSPR